MKVSRTALQAILNSPSPLGQYENNKKQSTPLKCLSNAKKIDAKPQDSQVDPPKQGALQQPSAVATHSPGGKRDDTLPGLSPHSIHGDAEGWDDLQDSSILHDLMNMTLSPKTPRSVLPEDESPTSLMALDKFMHRIYSPWNNSTPGSSHMSWTLNSSPDLASFKTPSPVKSQAQDEAKHAKIRSPFQAQEVVDEAALLESGSVSPLSVRNWQRDLMNQSLIETPNALVAPKTYDALKTPCSLFPSKALGDLSKN